MNCYFCGVVDLHLRPRADAAEGSPRFSAFASYSNLAVIDDDVARSQNVTEEVSFVSSRNKLSDPQNTILFFFSV